MVKFTHHSPHAHSRLQITKCRERREIWKQRALVALLLDIEDEVVHHTIFHTKKEHDNVELLKYAHVTYDV